jgi:phosphopantothenoylcysteine decarboxylase/phosphopantothenate--cysteine ligase
MANINGKKIVLGITGSIAVYKSAELVRHLKKAGAIVHVAMTENATWFVTPLTFETLAWNIN